MWTRAAAVAVGTALTAGGAAAETPVRPILAVWVVNLTDASNAVLRRAQEDAAIIVDLAGVEVIWQLEPAADEPSSVVSVRVVLHSGVRSETMSAEIRAGKTTMGFTPCAGALLQCRIAYIFYDRIAGVATRARVPAARVLGLTIAHEIGHMLLPRYSHSACGIMRPSLDLERAVLPQFTAVQASLIRTKLAKNR